MICPLLCFLLTRRKTVIPFTIRFCRSKENEHMLMTYTSSSYLASPSSLNLASVEDEIVSISTIPSMSSVVQTFSIEGTTLLPNRYQSYYMLACSNCNHFVRRKINCLTCTVESMLVPRCHFEVTDSTGTLTATIAETLAENMLSMTAEEVYNTVATKNEQPPVAHINRQFGHKLFSIQLQKPLFRMPDQKPNTFAISSFSKSIPCFWNIACICVFGRRK